MKALDLNTVVSIRMMREQEDRSVRNIAQELNLPKSTVGDVISRRTWGHIPEGEPLNLNPAYTIYPNGAIWSDTKNNTITPVGPKQDRVRLYSTQAGTRMTMFVDDLLAEHFPVQLKQAV